MSEEVMFFWFALGVPLTILITFFLIRKRIAPWLGLGDLRRRKKEGFIGGIAEMIANLKYTNPSSYRLLQIRFLVLAVIILAPEGSGLFMYLFLWAIIPAESDKERETRINNDNSYKKFNKMTRIGTWKPQDLEQKFDESFRWFDRKKMNLGIGRDSS